MNVREIKKTLLFWQEQEAMLSSMYLRANATASYLEEHEKKEILSYLPNLDKKDILDLASGIGRFTRYFSERGRSITSVDIAPQFVEKNRKDHADCNNVTCICSDAADFQMKENSVDFVFVNWLLLYLEDEEIIHLMDKIYTWLRPKGELFLRESCDITRSKKTTNGYYAHYRPISHYDHLIRERFTLIKEGHIKAYIQCFADPLQCYWHSQKSSVGGLVHVA